MTNILITGSESGLGKYLCEHFDNADRLTRTNCIDILSCKKRYEYIIHCAFNRDYSKDPERSMSEDIEMAKSMSEMAERKLIFMSSIDIYRDEYKVYSESKKQCEKIILESSEKNLVVRLCAMLGEYMKPNSFTKASEGKVKDLTLDLDSSFYYCLHSHVLKFIKLSILEDIRGVIDFVPKEKTTLREVVGCFDKSNQNTYKYITPHIDNSEIQKYMPEFANRCSLSIAKEFLERQDSK